jgi:hypothetical protein
MSYGMNGYIGLAKETTWGTPVSPGSFMEAMSEGLSATLDRFDTRNIFNNLSEPDDTTGLVRIAGDTVIPANPEGIGILLNAALGAVSVTSGTGGLQTAVFQIRNSDIGSLSPLQPYTLEAFRDVTSAQQYAGCVAQQLVLACQPNQDLRATVTWMGKSVLNKARVAAASVLFPTTPGQPFTFDTASLSIGGVATDLIEAFTLTVNNQLEGVAALNNSTNIARVQRTGPVMVNLSGQISFVNITEYQNFINQTEQAFVLNFFKAGSYSLKLDMPRVVYTAFPMGQQGRGRNVVAFEAKARVPIGSTSQIAATLKNLTIGY